MVEIMDNASDMCATTCYMYRCLQGYYMLHVRKARVWTRTGVRCVTRCEGPHVIRIRTEPLAVETTTRGAVNSWQCLTGETL